MLKMADQGWSDLHLVFTMIFVIFTSQLQIASQSLRPLSQYTIMLKMADQGWSDLHLVFTMIFVIFTSQLQIASQSLFIKFKSRMTSNGKLINVCFNLSAQRLMVKAAQKSDLS